MPQNPTRNKDDVRQAPEEGDPQMQGTPPGQVTGHDAAAADNQTSAKAKGAETDWESGRQDATH